MRVVINMPKRESKKGNPKRDTIDKMIDIGYIACHLGEISERLGHFKNDEINRKKMERVVMAYQLVGLVRKAKNELDGKGERSYIKKRNK